MAVEGGGKRHPLNMRTTKETRERLENAAAFSGRSIAQEVEIRLEQSFASDEVLRRLDAIERVLARLVAART